MLNNYGHGVWVPAFAGTTAEGVAPPVALTTADQISK
jgi:hypothetical protein